MTERRRVRIDGKPPKRDAPKQDVAAPPAECNCPRLDADDWNEVESDWGDITFVSSSTNAVLGVPVGYDVARKNLFAKAAKLGATVPEEPMILLGSGRFRRTILLEVEDVPPGAKGIERPGGIAFTQLMEAPWGEMRHKVDTAREVATQHYGRKPDNLWVWYVTCRECSHERNFETLIIAHYRQSP